MELIFTLDARSNLKHTCNPPAVIRTVQRGVRSTTWFDIIGDAIHGALVERGLIWPTIKIRACTSVLSRSAMMGFCQKETFFPVNGRVPEALSI